MRKQFADILHQKMKEDNSIFLIVADLGYLLFDRIREDFPDRFYNTGAAEQCAMGVAVGLALSNKVPVIYSITPFLLFRSAETIRNYINHESIPVKLIASGRDDDYLHDGFSHYAGDDKELLHLWPNIVSRWPVDEDEVRQVVEDMLHIDKPFYLNLKR